MRSSWKINRKIGVISEDIVAQVRRELERSTEDILLSPTLAMEYILQEIRKAIEPK